MFPPSYWSTYNSLLIPSSVFLPSLFHFTSVTHTYLRKEKKKAHVNDIITHTGQIYGYTLQAGHEASQPQGPYNYQKSLGKDERLICCGETEGLPTPPHTTRKRNPSLMCYSGMSFISQIGELNELQNIPTRPFPL